MEIKQRTIVSKRSITVDIDNGTQERITIDSGLLHAADVIRIAIISTTMVKIFKDFPIEGLIPGYNDNADLLYVGLVILDFKPMLVVGYTTPEECQSSIELYNINSPIAEGDPDDLPDISIALAYTLVPGAPKRYTDITAIGYKLFVVEQSPLCAASRHANLKTYFISPLPNGSVDAISNQPLEHHETEVKFKFGTSLNDEHLVVTSNAFSATYATLPITQH